MKEYNVVFLSDFFECWNIRAEVDVNFRATTFDVEDAYRCVYDFVEIFEEGKFTPNPHFSPFFFPFILSRYIFFRL